MTRKGNARLAGFMFLFYIATALPAFVISDRAARGDSVVAKLASIAQHETLFRMSIVLVFITFVDAVALGVGLYGLTRDEDHELALLALACRIGEGVINAMAAIRGLGLLSVAKASIAATGADTAAATALGALLFQEDKEGTLVSATCFAVGSTIFAYLFLRARSIPRWLAWTGLIGSVLLIVGLPLRIAGARLGILNSVMWAPVAVFEIVLGFWLLFRGVTDPRARNEWDQDRAP